MICFIAYNQKREMVIKMNKEEINNKTTECGSKTRILVFITGFFLLGTVLELIFRNNADNVFLIVLNVIAIIYIYIKMFKWFKIFKFLNLGIDSLKGG